MTEEITLNLYNKLKTDLHQISFKAGDLIIKEGERANKLYFIKKGLIRGWTLNDGKEITFQFLAEKQFFCCVSSFWFQKRAAYSVSSIDDTTLLVIEKSYFDKLIKSNSKLIPVFNEYMIRRFADYQKLLISRLKDKPEKRYKNLFQTNPEILLRAQQHYIASYLGITPVSLSRIRGRV